MFAALLGAGWFHGAAAEETKVEETPRFFQRDPDGDFDRDGTVNCGPVAVSNGLIYLENACGLDNLVDSTDYDGQIELIAELAEEMETDKAGGTRVDEVLTGLGKYIHNHGYEFESMEIVHPWPVSAANKKYKIGEIPKLEWMADAAEDPDAVVLFAVGWLNKSADGTYTRNGGHWVTVVGADLDTSQFDIYNPAMEPERQAEETTITLRKLRKDFWLKNKDGKTYSMAGFYGATGPGLGTKSIALLDSVIVFKLQPQADDDDDDDDENELEEDEEDGEFDE